MEDANPGTKVLAGSLGQSRLQLDGAFVAVGYASDTPRWFYVVQQRSCHGDRKSLGLATPGSGEDNTVPPAPEQLAAVRGYP